MANGFMVYTRRIPPLAQLHKIEKKNKNAKFSSQPPASVLIPFSKRPFSPAKYFSVAIFKIENLGKNSFRILGRVYKEGESTEIQIIVRENQKCHTAHVETPQLLNL